jgi:hypothetical protein
MTLSAWIRARESDTAALSSFVAIGVLMGFTFLARIDAVFFIAAITAWHVGADFFEHKKLSTRRLTESIAMGLTSILVGSPWLLYNLIAFGSLMPTSGIALGANAPLGQNLAQITPHLLENLSLVLAVPHFSTSVGVGGGLGLALLAAMFYLTWYLARHGDHRFALFSGFAALYASGLLVYYGFFFGAPHFLGRYLFPLLPLFALIEARLLLPLLSRLVDKRLIRSMLAFSALAAVLIVIGLHMRIYGNIGRGSARAHIQVVNWVRENASADSWVAAVQTGTLGFFHDRTINLDGKVNPEALKAKQRQAIPEYVADSEIRYLVDWQGLAGWMQYEAISESFDLIVNDKNANLAVFARRDAL